MRYRIIRIVPRPGALPGAAFAALETSPTDEVILLDGASAAAISQAGPETSRANDDISEKENP